MEPDHYEGIEKLDICYPEILFLDHKFQMKIASLRRKLMSPTFLKNKQKARQGPK